VEIVDDWDTVRFARRRVRKPPWYAVEPDWDPAPLAGEFEVVIMIAVAIEETDGLEMRIFQQFRGYIESSVIISRCSDTVRCKSRAKFE
jgi:hypothetical protein